MDKWIEGMEAKSKESDYYSIGDLRSVVPWVTYSVDSDKESICLDGTFTITELINLITHMKKYAKEEE